MPAGGTAMRYRFLVLSLVLLSSRLWASLGIDSAVSADSSNASSSITIRFFSTNSPNELLLAFIATDGQSAGVTVPGVSGAGLTWVLVQRTNTQLGTAEIWRAFA